MMLSLTALAHAEPWPSWRGNEAGDGIAPTHSAPLNWSADKHVRWRVDLPEPGNSTPIVWQNRIFVTQAVSPTHWRGLICFDRATGKELWHQGLTYNKPERSHRANPYCSASPTTDGQHVIAYYGSAGLVCYDLDGKEQWRRELGPIDHIWGHSTSPVIHGDLCIQYHGPGEGAYLIAVDKRTGQTVWRFDEPAWNTDKRTDGFRGRDDGVVGSFSTPIIIRNGDRDELIMSFPNQLIALDPATGKRLWHCDGLNPLVYTSPVYADGTLIAMGGYYGNTIAVKVAADSRGDITESQRLWQQVRHNGGIGTGVVKDGRLYYHNSGGIVFCLDIATGKTLWKQRLPGQGKSWGSFLLVGDNIYTLSQSGETVIFKASPIGLDVLAHNTLGEVTNSSPVPAGDDLILRTHNALWCITQPDAQ